MSEKAANSGQAPHVLHCHSTFAAGGKELRSVQLMNAFGASLRHTIVSGQSAEMAAANRIDKGIDVSFPADFPSLTGFPSPGRLVAIAQALKPYDLVLTYNWGAMDVVMAHTVFGPTFKLPPLIHHEDGFNEDEAERLKPSRNWFRRIALSRTSKLVVPSRVLETIALRHWQTDRARIERIPNGIDTEKFAAAPQPGAARVVKRKGEFWVGTLAGLRPVKQLPMLVRSFAELPNEWHLVIVGEGPERDAIRSEAAALDISHRVHVPGAIDDPSKVIGLFDIFALSSQSEQFPISVVEAMAAGLPIAAPDVGDVRDMVSPENRGYIAVADNTEALASVLLELSDNAALRRQIGQANQSKARERFDQKKMIAGYRALYDAALQRAL